jgi:hypothetical protein
MQRIKCGAGCSARRHVANDTLADDGGVSFRARKIGHLKVIACSAAIISESRRQSIRMTSNFAPHAASARLESQSQRPINTAAPIPASWAMMKASTPEGAMPAKVSESDRAIVTAGLANDVEAVNQ